MRILVVEDDDRLVPLLQRGLHERERDHFVEATRRQHSKDRLCLGLNPPLSLCRRAQVRLFSLPSLTKFSHDRLLLGAEVVDLFKQVAHIGENINPWRVLRIVEGERVQLAQHLKLHRWLTEYSQRPRFGGLGQLR